MKKRKFGYGDVICIAAFWFLGMDCSPAASIPIVAPEAAVTIPNGNSSFTPFAVTGSARFQQVISASTFSSVAPVGGVWIKQIVFRADPFVDKTIPSIQWNLSTTSRPVDSLSPVFDENVGSDDTVVSGPGAWRLVGGIYFSVLAADFRDHPFFYDPANGNLLMDLRVFTGSGDAPAGQELLDAFDITGDSVSSVFGRSASGIPISGVPGSLGLATALIVDVPEPSASALLSGGIAAAAFFRLFSKSRRSKCP